MIRFASREWFAHVAANAATALALVAVAIACASCANLRGSVAVTYGGNTLRASSDGKTTTVDLSADLEGLRK